MYDKLESIIKELNPSCRIGEYKDRIVKLFENEKVGEKKDSVENFVSLATLQAAVRWMEYYGDPINNNQKYREMMTDNTYGQSYKDDITAIRLALGKSQDQQRNEGVL